MYNFVLAITLIGSFIAILVGFVSACDSYHSPASHVIAGGLVFLGGSIMLCTVLCLLAWDNHADSTEDLNK